MSKLPAIQFYPGDWRKDPGVQALDYFQRGVWFEMLCIMHESNPRGYLLINGRAPTNDQLCRMLGLDNQILTTTLTTLLELGVASKDEATGAIYCRRMVRDEEVRQKRKISGSLGGNPSLVKQNPTKAAKGGYPKSNQGDNQNTEVEDEDKEAVQFDAFYQEYPLHVGKGQARKAFKTALKKAKFEEIMAGLAKYKQAANPQFYAHPSTWLNGERWLDEAAPQAKEMQQGLFSTWKPSKGHADYAAELAAKREQEGETQCLEA